MGVWGKGKRKGPSNQRTGIIGVVTYHWQTRAVTFRIGGERGVRVEWERMGKIQLLLGSYRGIGTVMVTLDSPRRLVAALMMVARFLRCDNCSLRLWSIISSVSGWGWHLVMVDALMAAVIRDRHMSWPVKAG